MTKSEKAVRFVECFCTADIEGVEALLSPALRFRGPLFQFNNRDDYIESLHNDLSDQCSYKMTSITENETEVALFYDYIKEGGTVTIAQLIQFDDQEKIAEMQVVFDARF